ncbi:MAG: M20 family metallopeptidase [Myxococcota bacterium]
MNSSALQRFTHDFWESEILPTLADYIKIPNQSPYFDVEWKAHGYMDEVVALARAWVDKHPIPGARLEVLEEPGRTPLLFLEVDGSADGTILLYGHLDKQPPMTGWDADLGPWKPVFKDGKLYGRGGADDGYALFSIVGAIQAIKAQNLAHPRLVAVIECCEESGSVDLPYYMDVLAERIGQPSLVICLDSGCGNYDQLWITTSLRGMIAGDLTVEVLSEGVHSGSASGIVPSSFRIVRQILDRVEDMTSGEIKPEFLRVHIPEHRVREAQATAEALGDMIYREFPFVPGMQPANSSLVELILNRTWRPTLSVTGQRGMPDLASAGNVLRPYTSLKLSFRLPPSLKVDGVKEQLTSLIERDPPYGAQVRFLCEKAGAGWEAPEVAPWLNRSAHEASKQFFGAPACYLGEGGSIPFMGMLGEKFPAAQFMITGVLGPRSNAHGPNEFLHIETGKAVTSSIARVIVDAVERGRA